MELSHTIEGHLVRSTSHGKPYYYLITENGDDGEKKSLSSNPDAVKQLARKEFLIKTIESLNNNIRLLENAEKHYMDELLDSIIFRMKRAYRDLPEEFFLKSDIGNDGIYRQSDDYCIRRHADWAKEPYKMSTYKPEGRKYPTSAGIKVRSKSEQHIVEQLVIYGVPFRYEEVIVIDGWEYSSDFTFRGGDMKKFYWEHAGMMDLPTYRESHKRKMGIFESVDIVPWKNLIITYDVDGMINIPMIKSIIEKDVIPRL